MYFEVPLPVIFGHMVVKGPISVTQFFTLLDGTVGDGNGCLAMVDNGQVGVTRVVYVGQCGKHPTPNLDRLNKLVEIDSKNKSRLLIYMVNLGLDYYKSLGS